MYGESITMMDAFVITLFSMGLVFVALVVLSYSIDVIANIINRGNKKKTDPAPVQEEVVSTEEDTVDDQELIAVISAAVACASGKSLNELLVRSVRRCASEESAWARAGRMDAMK